MLGEALDALALAGLLAVELLGVELLVQAEGLDFAVQARQLGLGRGGEVEPRLSGCLVLQLCARVVSVSKGRIEEGAEGCEEGAEETHVLEFLLGEPLAVLRGLWGRYGHGGRGDGGCGFLNCFDVWVADFEGARSPIL